MSHFKRFQSKVFWSQMENLDHKESNAFPTLPQLNQQEDDEESDSTTDVENVTVIHIESVDRERQEPASPEELADRSFSPASRGQRSQDSGFSDSGRSDSSGTSGLISPERRRRRKSSRRKRSHPRLVQVRVPLGVKNDVQIVGPAHTSTPKQDGKKSEVKVEELKGARQLDFSHVDCKIEEEEQQLSSLNSNNSEESLNDFLYAADFPDNPVSSSKSSTSIQNSYPRIVISSRIDGPVRMWLNELHLDLEDEPTSMLQNKKLPKRRHRDEEPETRDLRLLCASATTAAKKVVDVAENFEKIYQRFIDSVSSSESGGYDREALERFEAEATDILVKLGLSLPRRINLQENARTITIQLAKLKNSVDRALENRLDFYIEKVVQGLGDSTRAQTSAVRGALAALTALGLAGPRAGASVARCSGISALASTLVKTPRHQTELRCSTLRALASTCCCIDPVDQLVRDDGPSMLAEILNSESTPEAEKSEAAALLVQITAPWMEYIGLPYVEIYANELVKSLTDLAVGTTCKQTLLLAAAGINHLARSRKCIGAIVKFDSIKKLLRCVKKSNGGNVWLMEQVASLVGQIAKVPQARAHLVETRASVALVCFLRMQPPGLEDEYRRLAATASEALTRLCVDPEIAKQVVAVGGYDCLPSSDFNGNGDRNAGQFGEQQMFQSTKSLRVARKIAAVQIDMAKTLDHSPY